MGYTDIARIWVAPIMHIHYMCVKFMNFKGYFSTLHMYQFVIIFMLYKVTNIKILIFQL